MLLENTSITLTEVDSMNLKRKLEYYNFIMLRKKDEKDSIKGNKNEDNNEKLSFGELDLNI